MPGPAMTIADHDVGLPTGIDEVTPDWLTSVLRSSGVLGTDESVATVETEPFAVGVGLLSQLHRAHLSYGDGVEGPTTLIVKFPIDIPHQRAIADAFNVYGREVKAYREIASHSPILTPTVHAAIHDAEASHCCIVMEDLTGHTQVDTEAGASWEQACAAIDALAAFHARWHEHPDLGELAETFFDHGDPMFLGALPPVYEAGWPRTKELAADLLTDEVIAFGDRWAEHLPTMLQRSSTPKTILHNDWRSDNMFHADDGTPIVFDFQITGVGNGAFDLAYYLSQSLERATIRGRRPDLVHRYVERLATHGIERDAEAVLDDVRVITAFCIMYGFASFPEYEALPDEGKAMTRQLLRRCVEAIEDLDALAAIERAAPSAGH
ncbi:MAG: phosphotransferase [Actinomycetota bacterium]